VTNTDSERPQRAMIVMAHPDDAEFTCAGTIASWIPLGTEVFYIVCTTGNKGTKDEGLSPHQLAETREREELAAANVLGVKEVVFLRYNDGELETQSSFQVQMSLLIRHFRPDLILAHDAWRDYQIHPDHRAAGLGTMNGLIAARDHLYLPAQMVIGLRPHHTPQVYFFGSDNADHFVEIGDTIDKKIEALGQHHSQLDRIEGWQDRVRMWANKAGERIGVEYAEGFKKLVLF
jgi:LmbE family N-acetylglucosaminyl deacetylase